MKVKAIHRDKVAKHAKVKDQLLFEGLKKEEISTLQSLYGKNQFTKEQKGNFWHTVLDIAKEPMFLMLTGACLLYFLLGEAKEGALMLAAMIFVGAISIYQEVKSSHALEALKKYTEPKVMVVRDGVEQLIATEELLPGDIMILEEGNLIAADAQVI
ncbi:MAG: cation-transporting P-type ATPase, partial [Flavisolibacter sp.]